MHDLLSLVHPLSAARNLHTAFTVSFYLRILLSASVHHWFRTSAFKSSVIGFASTSAFSHPQSAYDLHYKLLPLNASSQESKADGQMRIADGWKRMKADESESRTVEGGCSKSVKVECGRRSLQWRWYFWHKCGLQTAESRWKRITDGWRWMFEIGEDRMRR